MDSAPASTSKARFQGIVIGLVIGVIVGGLIGVMAPDALTRAPAAKPIANAPRQPAAPVAISVKTDAGGSLEIKNTGSAPLANVGVIVINEGSHAEQRKTIGTLAPGETKTLSAKELEWTFAPGDRFEVAADGFSLQTYSSP